MAERKIKIPFPPAGGLVDGSDVPIKESNERWSEILLEDGTTIRLKPNVVSAVRIDGKYDPEGNPMYALKSNQVMVIANTPAHLKKDAAQKGIN